jgi:hypothetical protein
MRHYPFPTPLIGAPRLPGPLPAAMLAHARDAGPRTEKGEPRVGRCWLGIDIGGTFTDFTLYDTTTHGVTDLKVPSTPPDFARAVEDGLDALPAALLALAFDFGLGFIEKRMGPVQ